MKDEIITELWRIKDELAREANYDIHALCQKLREEENVSREKIVDRSDRSAATQKTE
jgi:hypothetical protein